VRVVCGEERKKQRPPGGGGKNKYLLWLRLVFTRERDKSDGAVI